MNTRFKAILIIVVLSVILTPDFIYIGNVDANTSKLEISVEPPIAGENASYLFRFVFNNSAGVHEWMHLSFPEGTSFPDLPEDKHEKNLILKKMTENIYIDSNPWDMTPSLPLLDPESFVIKFSSCIPFEGGVVHEILIKKECGIKNPKIPGLYTFKVRNQKNVDWVESQPYEILDVVSNSEKPFIKSIPLLEDSHFMKLQNNRFFVTIEFLEHIGIDTDYSISTNKDRRIPNQINLEIKPPLFGRDFEKQKIRIEVTDDFNTYYINGINYYLFRCDMTDKQRFPKNWISVRGLLEPFFKLNWNPESKIVEIYDSPIYNRVKLLPQSSEIIINYELHKLYTGLIKQNKEVFISLREFIELINGKIEYNSTSQYNSPEIAIKPVNIKKEIKIYPELNKAILINEDNKIREINLLNNLINKNGSYFIGINDIISILEAKRHTYLDSDINTYFNFEF